MWSGAGTYRWPWCGGPQELVDVIIQLAEHIRKAREAKELSPEQEAESAARNAEENRRQSRRTDMRKRPPGGWGPGGPPQRFLELAENGRAAQARRQAAARDVARAGEPSAARNAEEDRRLSRRTDAA